MAVNPSGFGGEAAGDPFGSGGPIHVNRAKAVKGQVVRVSFSEAPLAVSAAGIADATNPSNYILTVVTGQAGQPLAVGVDPDTISGPTLGVATGEVAVDLHVDRPLAVGVRYRVTVANVFSALGGSLGFPYSAEFYGIVQPAALPRPGRRTDLTDIRNDIAQGRYLTSPAGDLLNHSGVEGLRKRILRRLSTPRDAFAHLPGYGVGLALKSVASIAQLQAYQQDATNQVRQEPEIATATVSISQDATNPEVVRIEVQALTRTGKAVTVGASVGSDGVFLP